MLSKQEKNSERLKDRRDLRQALIHRRECIEGRIVAVEEQIKKLTKE